MITQLKSIVTSIEQLANEQMVTHKTRNLGNTDFSSAATLLTNNNFSIAKNCADPAKDCWKTSAEGTEKVTYRTISGTGNPSVSFSNPTVVLKNGAIISYQLTAVDAVYLWDGRFVIDVNGNDAPNIVGRDLFEISLSKTGNLQPHASFLDQYDLPACRGGQANTCFDIVLYRGWKMAY